MGRGSVKRPVVELDVDFASEAARRRLWEQLRQLPPARYLISVEGWEDRGTVQQIRYYRGVVLKTIADEIGYEPHELHVELKAKFATSYRFSKLLGRTIAVVDSSADWTKAEWSDYIDRVIRWAADYLHVSVPPPPNGT